ncbi:putative F-box protein PP2-B12 [Tasmannia lanceolata]|uniref:putative F-box protein PP2-B12 n=1 Tax=Tasmannia lanceolata TaxID=3420 RepID=UPI0040639AAA
MDLCSLPEGCISQIISLTSPKDASRSSVISSIFRSASDSDVVWDKFLPSDYSEILSRSVSPVEFSSKKDLYFRLCHPILIDEGKISFCLERSSGKKCYMLSSRELCIIWGDTPRYWQWISLPPESRFSEVAELLDVCWLDIKGRIDARMLSRKTNYVAYAVLKFQPDTYGFDAQPANLSVKLGGQESEHNVILKPNTAPMSRRLGVLSRRLGVVDLRSRWLLRTHTVSSRADEAEHLRARSDGWMEIEMGEFFNDEGDEGVVEISLMEVNGGHWKKGLIVEGIEIRPRA